MAYTLNDYPAVDRYVDMASGYVNPGSRGIPAYSLLFTLLLIGIYIYSIFDPSIEHTLGLYPDSILEPSAWYRMITYPLVHAGFLHIFFNVISMWAPLCDFERSNGTLHTMVVLLLLSIVCGVSYCVLGLFLFRHTFVLGASGLIFSLIAYFSYVNSLQYQSVDLFGRFEVPTVSVPFIFLALVFVMVPNSSFIGHLLGILAGFALAKGFFSAVLNRASDPIENVESSTNVLDSLPPSIKWIKESEVKDSRFQEDEISATLLGRSEQESQPEPTQRPVPRPAQPPAQQQQQQQQQQPANHAAKPDAFKGEGHVLGSNTQ